MKVFGMRGVRFVVRRRSKKEVVSDQNVIHRPHMGMKMAES